MSKADLVDQILSRDGGRDSGSPDYSGHDRAYRVAVWERLLAYIAAFVALGLVVLVVVRNEPFASVQIAALLKTVLSLSVAVLGATVPGFLHLTWKGGGAVVRAGGALALFLITYLFSPDVLPLEATGAVRFQFEDVDRSEPIHASLTLQYRGNGIDDEASCADGECLVQGAPHEIQPLGVKSAAYEFATEQAKLNSRTILLRRKDSRAFRQAIKPVSPDEDRAVRKPSREEYLASTRHNKPMEGGEVVVINKTDYHIELVLLPWKPKAFDFGTFSRREVWLPTCPPRQTKVYPIREDDPTVYYFMYASVFGQTAQYLIQGSLHDPDLLTVEIELASLISGELVARMSRTQHTASLNGGIQ